MLTLEECKKIDPDLRNISDEELKAIRDCLYGLGELAIKDWMRTVPKIPLGIAKSKLTEYD